MSAGRGDDCDHHVCGVPADGRLSLCGTVMGSGVALGRGLHRRRRLRHLVVEASSGGGAPRPRPVRRHAAEALTYEQATNKASIHIHGNFL